MKGTLELKTLESNPVIEQKIRRFFLANRYYELETSKRNKLSFQNYQESLSELSPLRFEDQIELEIRPNEVKYRVKNTINMSAFDQEYFLDLLDTLHENIETDKLVLMDKNKYEGIVEDHNSDYATIGNLILIVGSILITIVGIYNEVGEIYVYALGFGAALFLKYTYGKKLITALRK